MSEQDGSSRVDIVAADNTSFCHTQFERKDGRIYMRAKKRRLLS